MGKVLLQTIEIAVDADTVVTEALKLAVTSGLADAIGEDAFNAMKGSITSLDDNFITSAQTSTASIAAPALTEFGLPVIACRPVGVGVLVDTDEFLANAGDNVAAYFADHFAPAEGGQA